MRLLICGSRDYNRYLPMKSVVEKVVAGQGPVAILHGGAKGADHLAACIAKFYKYKEEVYPVTDTEWRELGKGAGPRRNQRMLDASPDRVLAFYTDINNKSAGTSDMVRRARHAGIDVKEY